MRRLVALPTMLVPEHVLIAMATTMDIIKKKFLQYMIKLGEKVDGATMMVQTVFRLP